MRPPLLPDEAVVDALTEEQLTQLLADRDTYAAEMSLVEFARQAWHVLEPETKFRTGWAVAAIAEHLQAVTDGQIRRLLINCPPGMSKSVLVNVMWPSWEWGPRRMAHHRFITASYEKGLATRDLVRARDLVRSEWFQQRWPVGFKADQGLKTYYENDHTGWRMAASVGSSLIGYRGDRVGIDDPHSVKTAESVLRREESLRWLTETVPTRLNDPDRSAICCIMQRLHERDASGLIIQDLGPEWVHLCLQMRHEKTYVCFTPVRPAPEYFPEAKPERMRRELVSGEPLPKFVVDPEGELLYKQDPRTEDGELLFPDRFSERAVAELEETLSAHGGSYAVASQLQQRPTARGGGMFKRADFRPWEGALPEGRRVVRGWDLAATTKSRSAYTAGVRMSRALDGRFIIEDVVRDRYSSLDVERLIQSCCEADGARCRASIPQDPGASGVAWKEHMAAKLAGHDVRFSPETGDKDFRATPFAAQVEAGMVYYVQASWNADYLGELAAFGPGAAYKDMVDASSRAFSELAKDRGPGLAMVGPELVT